jgi:hypothetical protein
VPVRRAADRPPAGGGRLVPAPEALLRPGAEPNGVRRPAAPRPAAGVAALAAASCCAELRCGCGSLLARRVEAGVELKCRRCKRTLVLPLSEG